jgi:uncharacterized coiled-coil protein SlyX
MAKQTETTASPMGFGDLGVIRNILMGEQISKIDESLANQNALIEQLQSQLAENAKTFAAQIAQLDKQIQERLSALDAKVQQNQDHQNSSLKSSIEAERNHLSALLKTVSDQLAK